MLFARENGTIRCVACGHRCLIREGRRGICKVRWVEDGVLRSPHGYVAGLACDPIEKKPFFHVLPGTDALSFGMLGCDLHCPYCQNWMTSQTLRDPVAGTSPQEISARSVVDLAEQYGAPIIASTYNEPLITAEWAHEILTLAKERGIRGAFVSNGNGTPIVALTDPGGMRGMAPPRRGGDPTPRGRQAFAEDPTLACSPAAPPLKIDIGIEIITGPSPSGPISISIAISTPLSAGTTRRSEVGATPARR